MQTIYKYELEMTDKQFVETHKWWRPLSVGNQNGKLVMWALVDTRQPKVKLPISIFGTGDSIPDEFDLDECGHTFLGSVQIETLVWHVFQ